MSKNSGGCEKEDQGGGKAKSAKEKLNMDREERDILNKLKSLPPTNELLNYYQETLSKYEKQDEYLLQRLLALSNILDNSDRLRMELESRDRFISELQHKYHQSQEELLNERRRNKEQQTSSSDRRKFGKFSDRDGSRTRAYSRSFDDDSKSQVEHLREQICSQEQIHKQEQERERELRLRMVSETRQNIANHHCRIEELEQTINCLREELERITRKCVQEREEHRKEETSWLQQRTKMSRKLCFYEKFGRPESCERIGQHTSDRVPTRIAEEKVLRAEATKLKEELKEKDSLVSELRLELGQMAQDNLMMKKDMDNLNTCIQKIKDKTGSQIEMLNQRNEKLEQRRRREVEGYESDIQRLKANIKNLESKIMALTASKEQEKENAKILDEIRDELKKKEKRARKPDWVD
eukprot:TRINITY_DN39093_c0_g1_i1.p1 TRINITY_DN39093_c0_g1~~TRINITY_DN39093_c0_g1_i1.p1  ORF type:complete len:422 (+),score=87.65 TRINITY_DN39093_c0_g1_i1:39-1268(+)